MVQQTITIEYHLGITIFDAYLKSFFFSFFLFWFAFYDLYDVHRKKRKFYRIVATIMCRP